MISRKEMQDKVKDYQEITIGILGSHSGEELGISAKAMGFKTVIICEKGRDELYTRYNRKLYDTIILVDSFKDILKPEIQQKLNSINTIFIPNRSFSVYLGYREIENNFRVPLYGSRNLLAIEDRNNEKNQYYLLEKAGIRTPKKYGGPEDIDRLSIIKVQQKNNPLERAFFYAKDYADYKKNSEKLIRDNIISETDLKDARIEEFIIGPRFNANFQSYALKQNPDENGEPTTIDFAGFEDRIQTNLGGILNLPAQDQLNLGEINISNEEIGHHGITMRESKKMLIYEAAEKFKKACQKEFPPGIIGLFSLQGAMPETENGPEFVVFDVSPRIPGCPCVGPTSPEMRRLSIIRKKQIESPIDLSMLEIKKALNEGRLSEIVT